MAHQHKEPEEKDARIQSQRAEKYQKIHTLHDFRHSYTVDMFMQDLAGYFGDDVDLNLEKIRERIEEPDRLKRLIQQAQAKNTHPVTEFVQELFRDLGKSGDDTWPDELERGEFPLDE